MSRPEERTCWESRRHAIVLARPVARAVVLGLAGFACFLLGWPWMLAAPPLTAFGALGAARSIWRWERTKVLITTERLVVLHGTLRRSAASVHLGRVGTVEVEQSLLGRLLGYGTLVAGELEIPFVPEPRDVGSLVARLGA